MEIKREDILYLAELSAFGGPRQEGQAEVALGEAEVEALRADLQSIIKYISQLDALDTEDVEPTYQVFEMKNVWREDEILPQEAGRDLLLALTKEEKDCQIKVPKVL